jgi:hypothetical protein
VVPLSENIVAITPQDAQVVVIPEEKFLSVSAPGPPGPQGPIGPAAGAAIIYSQTTPAATWPITHNLGRPVGIVIRLTTGEIVNTDIDQNNLNVAVLTFPVPYAGEALVI